MIMNDELRQEFSNILFLLPASTDAFNQFLDYVSLHSVDISFVDFRELSKNFCNFEPERLEGSKVKGNLVPNCLVAALKHMMQVSN